MTDKPTRKERFCLQANRTKAVADNHTNAGIINESSRQLIHRLCDMAMERCDSDEAGAACLLIFAAAKTHPFSTALLQKKLNEHATAMAAVEQMLAVKLPNENRN